MLKNPFVAGLLLEYRLESIGGIVSVVRAIKFKNKGTRKIILFYVLHNILFKKMLITQLNIFFRTLSPNIIKKVIKKRELKIKSRFIFR